MPPEGFDRALGARYQLDERIGSGATGEVWRGVHVRSGEVVAAKLLHAHYVEDADLVERFVRERSILNGLRHRNVVGVRDLVVDGDRLAIVMELVGGGSLRDALTEHGPLRPQDALRVVAAVLDALAAAHARGVLHRDVKPDNVLLAEPGEYAGDGAVKLSDFGIAEIVAGSANQARDRIGTPEYMAPEQLGPGPELASDVYAAGIVLYELLAGRTPFAGPGTPQVVAQRHVDSDVPWLPVPGSIWAELSALLAKNPTLRPTAAAAAASLRELAGSVADLDALAVQDGPEDFSTARPLTEVRGFVEPAAEAEVVDAGHGAEEEDDTRGDPEPEGDEADAEPVRRARPKRDLGTGQETMLRSMPALPAETEPRPSATPSTGSRLPAWLRSRRSWAMVAIGAVLVAVGTWWIIHTALSKSPPTPPATVEVKAQQQDAALPSGLGISRSVTWDPAQGTATLSITYSTQLGPLTGPFLEVLPGVGAAPQACPAVQWQGVPARLNVATVTGLDAACAWAVDVPQIRARSKTTVTAELPLALPAADAASALQDWLDSAAAATAAATSDGEVTSSAYPAQRLTDIQVVGPSRTVSGRTLRLSLVPVWPNGPDALHPLFRSPPSGEPTANLVAIAGGVDGVRFTDGCSGALSVSDDRLVVTADSVAQDCQVDARVGNFTELASNPFEIATRGS